ncbi:MAG: hypothetical protein K8T26_19760 [Lentisphaerae bacterium]|nr:hypothetical protein [Lentisphaerota bacterium]
MTVVMTPYLQRIWNHLVRRYRLRIKQDTDDLRVLSRERAGERTGGLKNCIVELSRYVLTYYKRLDYLEFKTLTVTRRFRHGKQVKETIDGDWPDFTVNGSGSIRRMYHGPPGPGRRVRTISLRNYYQLGDDCLARLIMVTSDDLAWINELPVTYHPLSNKDLPVIKSLDNLFAHFTGPGIEIPKRLRHAVPLDELFVLVQLVPGNYLNALAATVKHTRRLQKEPTNASRVLYWYYRGAVEDPNELHFQTVYCYVGCCRALDRQVNPRIRSAARLKSERNAMMRVRWLQRTPEIRTDSKFILKRLEFGDVKLELINDNKRLLQEATEMKSCVHTYALDVIDGKCALYHVTYRNKGYTLEVRQDFKRRLYAQQLLGHGNQEAPKRLTRCLQQVLAAPNS